MSVIKEDSEILHEDKIAASAHWSLLMRRDTTLRLTDSNGGANVGMLLYNPQQTLERYNAPDTLKCQHTFKLTQGHCLYSDMGRIFCSITEDSIGWHDTVGGYLSEQTMLKKYDTLTYQQALNGRTLSGEHSFLVEMAKHGLNARDLSANLNFFSKVSVDESGQLLFQTEHSSAGSYVDLRFEMDTLVIMHTCPHPLNPSIEYPRKPITYQIRHSQPIGEHDLCRDACAENQRGFQNNQLYHLPGGH